MAHTERNAKKPYHHKCHLESPFVLCSCYQVVVLDNEVGGMEEGS